MERKEKIVSSDESKRLFAQAREQSRSGDTRGVVETMRELVKLSPKSGIFSAVLANALKSLGETAEAERRFRDAVALSPRSEKISLGLFHSLWSQGKEEEALEEVRRFLTVADSEEYRTILDAILKAD
jgi:Flp pilus assembly protein TadD